MSQKLWRSSRLHCSHNYELHHAKMCLQAYADSEDPDQPAYLCSMLNRDYYMAIFISNPISTRDTHISPWADMGVSGWYGVWYENCHIIIYLSYICLSDKFAYLISYAVSKARPPSAQNVVRWAFCMGKKTVSPMWPGDMGFFCPGKKAVSPTWPIITPFAFHKSDMCLKAVSITYAK